LKIQEELGLSIKKLSYSCTFCKKEFTTKKSHTYHLNICKSVIVVKQDRIVSVEEKTKHIKEKLDKLEQLSSDFRNHKEEVEYELQKQDEIIKELEDYINKTSKLEFELGKRDKQIYELYEKVNRLESLFTNSQLQSHPIPPTQSHPSPPTQSTHPVQSPPTASQQTQPYKKARIPKAIKTMVWNSYIGSSVAESTCMCCKQERITIREFQCGHVLAEANGGQLNISNLRPICHPCNMSMGTQHMSEFVKTFFGRDSL
jgi:phosphoglycerate-specific signal transduction histidine kinase